MSKFVLACCWLNASPIWIAENFIVLTNSPTFFLKQNDILSDLIASWMFGGILIIKQLTSAGQIMTRFLSLRPIYVLVITWKYLIFILTNNSPFIFFMQWFSSTPYTMVLMDWLFDTGAIPIVLWVTLWVKPYAPGVKRSTEGGNEI